METSPTTCRLLWGKTHPRPFEGRRPHFIFPSPHWLLSFCTNIHSHEYPLAQTAAIPGGHCNPLRARPTIVSDNESSSSNDKPKKFRITRKRLGIIRFVDPKGEYGFIDAEDFREDVFFHKSVFDSRSTGPLNLSSKRKQRFSRSERDRVEVAPLNPEELVQRHVEFELDDEMFESEKRLRATVVNPTSRPMGRKLSGRDATFKIVTHHPRARRKRPDWRK